MSQKPRILIVDDEPNIRRILEVAFEKGGYQASTAPNAQAALEVLESQAMDVVITDVTMPGMNGYKLQDQIQARWPELPVIICTAYGTIQEAVAAIRNGAFEFVTKPFDLENLKKIVKSALESGSAPKTRSKTAKKGKTAIHFVAESPAMKQVLETIEQVAESKATVLVLGESGTGKEVISKLLHEMSSRAAGPFIATSCAALPETLLESELFGYEKGAFTGANGSKMGRFEAANEGTLFLDEIGEVPLSIQAKLLRVLQEREFERLGSNKPTRVDVRLITATNRNLQREVDAGNFRLDLLYRLQVIEINLPPLRERQEDLMPLASHFLAHYGTENGHAFEGFTADAEKALRHYPWPGNVRELSNVIERAVVLTPKGVQYVEAKYLPKNVQAA
ncbi:MAG: sigma-54-dependent Fis family transcriptional regulator [Chthonomonas sp.]|nr:sigma-54-dependent Fis family transcriptional regulator [Chthonomonas sp.]